ncbi:MAG: CD3324 family protein [Eubacteriales bacterium]|nr:CD3324 family protein [Eubacteriales bacterium]
MGYKRAEDILPSEIIAQIQDYVDGEYLYIPRKEENRKAWGEGTNTRQELKERDRQILQDFLDGASKQELAGRYYLSEKSIGRIIYQEKKNQNERGPLQE